MWGQDEEKLGLGGDGMCTAEEPSPPHQVLSDPSQASEADPWTHAAQVALSLPFLFPPFSPTPPP
jgi:hypothetical protein